MDSLPWWLPEFRVVILWSDSQRWKTSRRKEESVSGWQTPGRSCVVFQPALPRCHWLPPPLYLKGYKNNSISWSRERQGPQGWMERQNLPLPISKSSNLLPLWPNFKVIFCRVRQGPRTLGLQVKGAAITPVQRPADLFQGTSSCLPLTDILLSI